MKVLIVDDDEDQSLVLRRFVEKQGHVPDVCSNGRDAFARFKAGEYPLVITDWMMPGVTGPELCGMIRALSRRSYPYLILMTGMKEPSNYIEGLNAGADDFIDKPIHYGELAARITVADRIQRLHNHVSALEGMLSICAECKKIRDDGGEWVGVESYMSQRTDLSFSHGYCPACLEKTRKAWGLRPAP